MAINFALNDYLVAKQSYVNHTLSQLPSTPNLVRTIASLGRLGTTPSRVTATGTVDVFERGQAFTRSFITVLPNDEKNLAYNGGEGVTIYFDTDEYLNNSFEYSTAYLCDVCSVRAINSSGVTIPKFAVVQYTGFDTTSQLPAIALANAATTANSRVMGMAEQEILDGEEGTITVQGSISGVDTSGMSINDTVYLSDTPGEFSDTAGTVSSIVGRVQTVGSQGAISIAGELPLEGTSTSAIDGNPGQWTVSGTTLLPNSDSQIVRGSFVSNYDQGGSGFKVAHSTLGTFITIDSSYGLIGGGGGMGIGWTNTNFSTDAIDTAIRRLSAGILGITDGSGTADSDLRDLRLRGVQVGASTITITSGTGTPEGAVTAGVGSLYLRTDGGANTTLYVKESGSGNTGWAVAEAPIGVGSRPVATVGRASVADTDIDIVVPAAKLVAGAVIDYEFLGFVNGAATFALDVIHSGGTLAYLSSSPGAASRLDFKLRIVVLTAGSGGTCALQGRLMTYPSAGGATSATGDDAEDNLNTTGDLTIRLRRTAGTGSFRGRAYVEHWASP